MTDLSKKLMLVLIPVLVLLLACVGLLFFLPDNIGGNVYLEQINTARKLAENGDYQKAIIYYTNAIKEDDTQEDPYLELARIYFQLNMTEDGFNILRNGVAKTNSLRIIQTLEYYEGQFGDGANNAEKLKILDTVDFNSVCTNVFATYDYEKYTNDCTVKQEKLRADAYTVVYEQYDAVFEYVNSLNNVVIDQSTGKPYPYARPTSIKLNKLSQLISGIESGVSVEQLKICGATDVKLLPFDKKLDTRLLSFVYMDMKITVACDDKGTVTGDEVYNEIIPAPGQSADTKTETTGKIIDATTGKNVSDVTLNFRSGKNNKSGDAVASETSQNGEYAVELAPGDYTVEVIAEGYNSEFFDLCISDNSTDVEQNFNISPTLFSGEIRFVLEWGSEPNDLDSYLEGRTSSGTEVSVNYIRLNASDGEKAVADLDLDDRDGFGPETITLHETNGKYEYKVHRFSPFGDLASSGATVKIYTSSSSEPIVVTVPDGVDSEWWTVCTVENGEIKDINGKRN